MKRKAKQSVLARHLRMRGLSVNTIAKELLVAKSSVSMWVRDITLTKLQKKRLSRNVHSREVVQRRVATRLKNEKAKRRRVIDRHKQAIASLQISNSALLVLGCALYWAEGAKSEKNRIFNFSNSDPDMVRVIMLFLKKICTVPVQKMRGHIHLHPHLNAAKAKGYWAKISGIPESQFYKTSTALSRSSKNTRDTLPYGTFSVQINSVDLFLRMHGWIESISEKTLHRS